MAERRSAGSWLSGTFGTDAAGEFPGQRLGLPEQGPRSAAGMGRRLGALFIDWMLSTVIALGVVSLLAKGRAGPLEVQSLQHQVQWWTLLIFGVQAWLLTALTGLSIGKRALGMRVVRLDGRPVGLGWSLVRTLLLLAVIPPLFTDRDHRGLHDRAANTAVIRT